MENFFSLNQAQENSFFRCCFFKTATCVHGLSWYHTIGVPAPCSHELEKVSDLIYVEDKAMSE